MKKKVNKLTTKQKMLMEAIDHFIDCYGFSPTYKELGKMLDCSPVSIFQRVLLLEKMGYLSTVVGTCRTIKIIRKMEDNL